MAIKKNDFVEMDYTGRLKEPAEVFDTTEEKVAKEAQIFSSKAEYKPIIICVGEHQILPGIDEFLVGKDVGKFKLELAPEKAFGKKDAKLVQMIPVKKFEEQNIQAVPGLRLNIDGAVGIIKSVSSGRCVIDFNHPLAGRDVAYEINVRRIVTDKKEQLSALLRVLFGIRNPDVAVTGTKAVITFPGELPQQLVEPLAKKLKDLTGCDVSFAKKEEKKAEKK